MNFLYPLFALGALAIAAPIILHLRRKSQDRLLPFSAVRFLDDQPLPKASPLHLRDLLLFCLRALALLAIVAAFTWPFVGVDPTRNITKSHVYLLDATLSNQAADTFRKNKEAVLREVRAANSETQIAVVALGNQPQILGNFGDARETLISRLEAQEVTYQRGSYLSGLRQAVSLLSNALGEQREIFIAGDQQKNQWTEHINTAPFIPASVKVTGLREPEKTSRPNLGVAEPVARSLFVGNKAGADFSLKVIHSGGAESATVTVKANGEVVLRRLLDLKEQPDAVVLRAQWEIDPKQWVNGEVEISGPNNDLKADDKVFFSIAPVKEGRVTVLSQSRYLRAALAPEVMQGRWRADFVAPSAVAEAAKRPDLNDALIIDASYLQSKEARALVQRYLSNGRGILLLLNRVNPLIHGFLRELGFDIGTAQGGVSEPVKTPTKFQYIASLHPVLMPFVSPEFGNLLEVKVLEHIPLRGEGMPLIFAENGDALLVEGTHAGGRLMLFAFGFDRAQTNWASQASFLPFLDLCLQHARAVAAPQETTEPGDALVVQTPATVKQVTIRSGEKVLATAAVDETRSATLTAPAEPGLFGIFFDNSPTPERMVAVNPPVRESDLEYIVEMPALASWQTQGDNSPKPDLAPEENPLLVGVKASLLQQKFWWWLLVAGIVALLLEMCSLITRKSPNGKSARTSAATAGSNTAFETR